LTRAAGADDPEITDRTLTALRNAGERAYALNAFAAAGRYFEDALALAGVGDVRARLLFAWAQALHLAADDRREAALGEAREALLEAGLEEEAVEADAFLAQALWYRGRREESQAALVRATERAAGLADSPAKARVIAFSARFTSLAGDEEGGLLMAEKALALAERLSLRELQAHALTTIGTARGSDDGDAAVRDLEAALAIALDENSPIASTIVNNLGVLAFVRGDVKRAAELYGEARVVAEKVGDRDGQRWARGNLIGTRLIQGEWALAARLADEFIAECERSPHYLEHGARETRALTRLGIGDEAGAIDDYRRAIELAREIQDPQTLLPSLLHAVRGYYALGRTDEARALAHEAVAIVRRFPGPRIALGIAAAYFRELGIADAVQELIGEPATRWQAAILAAAEGRRLDAADGYAAMGAATPANELRNAHAQQLVVEGRQAEAEPIIRDVIAFYERVGATSFADAARKLLSPATEAYSDSA